MGYGSYRTCLGIVPAHFFLPGDGCRACKFVHSGSYLPDLETRHNPLPRLGAVQPRWIFHLARLSCIMLAYLAASAAMDSGITCRCWCASRANRSVPLRYALLYGSSLQRCSRRVVRDAAQDDHERRHLGMVRFYPHWVSVPDRASSLSKIAAAQSS